MFSGGSMSQGILHKKTRNSWLLEAIEEKINRDIGHN